MPLRHLQVPRAPGERGRGCHTAADQYLGESLSERLHIMTVPSPESHWFE
eukprot:COSAG02_NODE_17330_length_1012_cov_0.904710_1_plen_49_part_10